MEGLRGQSNKKKEFFFFFLSKLFTTFSHLYHDGSRIIPLWEQEDHQSGILRPVYVHSDSTTF